jgi:hypothetical protein
MENSDKIRKLLLKFSHLGIKRIETTGALLIGSAPHVAEDAWLNHIFDPINEHDIIKLEKEINKKIPSSYVDFLMHFSNGLKILCDTLSLYGYRYNYIRTEEFIWQPYSLIEPNKYGRPKNSTRDMLFFGFYDWGAGSYLYMTPDEKVHFCSRSDATSLFTWNSLSEMLISEIERLYKLFDSKGIAINEFQPTTPVLI